MKTKHFKVQRMISKSNFKTLLVQFLPSGLCKAKLHAWKFQLKTLSQDTFWHLKAFEND